MKRTIFSGARGENITPHRTVFSFFKHQAILIFFVMMIHSAAFSQPNKVWTQEINSAGSGRDWATFTMEDADGNIVGNGFTSFGGDVVPAIYKLDKNGTHLWTNPKWINQCGSGQYNYGQCGSMIQKKSGTTFGNYLVITKEKPCSGGVDRTAVYEIEKTTGAVVASNLNVFSALSWATSGGSGILQKPDQSGYIIIGFFATSLSGQKDIYVATLNNSLQLESRPVNLCAGNCMNGINVCTYGLSIGDDRPSSIEYIYSGGRSAEGDKTGDRLSNGGYFLGSHVGYIISGFSRNSSGNDDVYILRIKTDLCPVYEDWINSATLPSYIWARQYTTSNNCSPATLSANDIGGKVIQLPNNILLFGCHNGFEYVFDKGYAISAVFNEYRCSGDCLAGCPLGEYKEGDAALLLYKDFELYSYSCTPSHGLVKALNVAHMSGADFGFSSIYMKGVGAQKFISFGSSRDNGVIPSGSTSTHFYMLQTDLNGIRDWSKVFQGLTPNVGGCGFGLDFLDGGVSPLFDAGFIVSGNNGNNNHDAVFIRLSHTCGVDPVLTTVINPNPPHGVTWNTPRTIDGEVRIVNGARLLITGTTIQFANACSGIVVENGGILDITNGTVLTKMTSDNYLWKGITGQPTALISISGAGTIIEHAVIGAEGTSLSPNSTTISVSSGAAFRNNQKAIKFTGFGGASISVSIVSANFSIDNNVVSAVTNPVRFIELITPNKTTVKGTTFSDVLSTLDVQAINKNGGNQLIVGGTVSADYCTFNGVDKGIYLQGSTASDRILNNTFTNIPAVSYSPPGGYSWGSNYGIFAVGSSKFRAEGNSFTGTSRLSLNKIYGIVTDNSGATGALMFKNTFSNTSSGFQSQNGNPNFAASCNTFTNYTYSGSYGPAWYTYNGTLRQQGNNVCTNSGDRAGNEWTSTCTGSNVVDIKINGSGSYFHYYGHFLDQQLGDKTRPECSTTGWETSSWLHYCPNPTDPGYTKSSSACDFPFYTCPGCRVSGNDLGIDPQLLQAMDYYQSMADDFSAQSESASGQSAIEQSAYYAGLVQLVSNEIVSQLLSRSVDTAILYLEGSDLLEDKKLLAELYLSVGRFDDCRKTVDNVIAAQGWKRAELLNADDIASYSLENNEFVELLNLLLSIFESGRGLDKSDEQEIAALEGLSQSLTVNGPKACAYLKAATGKECSYSIYSDEQGEQVKERLGGSEQGSNIEVKAYPNPANTQLNISVFIPEGSIKPELIVYDITGRKQEQILLNTKQNEIELNTSSYGEGVYLLQVKTVDSSRTLRVSVQK